MLKKIVAVVIIVIVGTLVWLLLPRIPNPEPDSQTELSRTAYDTTLIEEAWPVPGPDARARARMIMSGEDIIFEDGPTDLIMNTHSMRKAVLSLLYGIAVDKGLIDLDRTLADLGIDEIPPLTDQEKTATIRDLLMFRSGIYLPAAGEHDSQITQRPARDSHAPGEYFFSNNFDANALGTIFTQETGYEMGAFMEEFLARPLGMQDFDANNVVIGDPWFWPSQETLHTQYYIYLSARDTARIGVLVAQGGVWNGQQIISRDWMDLSTAPHSDLSESHIVYQRYDAFGYQWALDSNSGTIWTDGYGGHFMLSDPVRNLTIVERNYTGNSYLSTARWLFGEDRRSNSRDGMVRAHALLAGLDPQDR